MDRLRRKRLIDGLMDAYVDWRNACARVNDAYRSWGLDTGSRDRVTFVRYMAALDAEERAAQAYATAVRRVNRRLWGEGPRAEALGERAREVG
jgi:hypothetical protein